MARFAYDKNGEMEAKENRGVMEKGTIA